MRWKPILNEMTPYKPGKSTEDVKKEFGLTDIVKLASNENPYGQPKEAAALLKNPYELEIYPDGYAASLREKIASTLAIDTEELLFGSGSDEIIVIIARALLGEGTNTICATPTFPQYRHHAVIEGAEVKEIPLTAEGEHDLPKFLAAIDEHTSVIWLCSPNNPTGNIIDSTDLQNFLKEVPEDILVVLDEAYYEYITDETFEDTTHLFRTYPNVLSLRTFSKAFGLAGLRVGYAIGNETVISQLNKARSPFNNTSISLAVAEKAFDDKAFIARCRELNAEQKKRFKQFAKEHQLHLYPSEANFVLMQVPNTMTANEASDCLLEKGYIVRSGDLLGSPGYIRVTVGTPEQNDGFFEAFKTLFS
ncbi:MAG TPA: histidinol-phosphate transaminase [Sporosarcina sp.]|nr:histidinol-phosphate transaminase [Sporosarcina sp.]